MYAMQVLLLLVKLGKLSYPQIRQFLDVVGQSLTA